MSKKSGNPTAAPARPVQPRYGRMDIGLDKVADSVARSVEWLFSQQHADGYWCGELEADVMLEADYIFMHTLLGTGDPGKMQRALNEILRHQNADGGWGQYPGGPSFVDYGVKAYLAHAVDHAPLQILRIVSPILADQIGHVKRESVATPVGIGMERGPVFALV